MRELWTAASPAFEGRYYRFSGAAFEPKPVQRPIPIWIGGHAKPVLRRTARLAQAWHASEIPVEEVAEKYAFIQGLASPAPFLTYRMYLRPTEIDPAPMRSPAPTFEGDRQQTIEYVRSYTERLPIEHLVVEFVWWCPPPGTCATRSAGSPRKCARRSSRSIAPLFWLADANLLMVAGRTR